MNTIGIINENEKALCRACMEKAMECGASAVRVSLSKSIQNSISILDGEVDKICYNEDRSIYLNIYAGGRYGCYSTNRLKSKDLDSFVDMAVQTTLLMAPDPCRGLPMPHTKATACTDGCELELADPSYHEISQESKIAAALAAGKIDQSYESLECEYSDNMDDNYIIDSDGFEGRHTESSFGFCCEIVIEDPEGNKHSAYKWTSAPFYKDFKPGELCKQAYEEALSQFGPKPVSNGKKTVVVMAKCASRLIGPIISALDGNSMQQKLSFLQDSMGKQLFPESFNLYDDATRKGRAGSRLFDTEGVAVHEGPIIEKGVVKRYFVNSYCAKKTGMEPTVEGPSRPCVLPFICNSDKKEISLEDIMRECGEGIVVSGFNGGNCNPANGDFSFGIEGYAFENGKITHPLEEALMTGNMLELWGNFKAAGSDALAQARWQIPSLAFGNVDINT